MHVASVGEFNSVRWLIDELEKHFEVVLTYFSPRARDYLINSNLKFVQRVPLTPWGIKSLENLIKPRAFFLVERELWPPFKLIRSRKIWIGAYSRGGFLERWIGKDFELVLTRTQKDAELMSKAGIRARCCGNPKWVLKEPKDLKLKLEGRLIVLGSSHEGEEVLIKHVFRELLKEFEDLKLIVAPRHIKRADRVLEIFKDLGAKKRSENSNTWRVLILDTLGELFGIYKYANAIVMGGTFVKIGGHNIAEAMFFKKPVIFGPYTHKIKDMVETSLEMGLGYRAMDVKDLEFILKNLLKNPQERIHIKDIASSVKECYILEVFKFLE